MGGVRGGKKCTQNFYKKKWKAATWKTKKMGS